MLGAITGDTVGSTYEFNNTKYYDFELLPEGSQYTDDSIMTLAVARWLLEDKELSYQGLEDRVLLFGRAFPNPKGSYGGGFYRWLFHPESLRPYDDRYGPLPYKSTSSRHPYGSWGNGSAMRAGSIGWFFTTIEETEKAAHISAAITHNHPEGIKGAQATAAAVFLARTGASREDIRKYIEGRFGYDMQRTWEDYHPRYGWDESCQGTVPQALVCALDSVDFEDAIRKAVSLGGDSDTLACITGAVAEALYKEIPLDIARYVVGKLPPLLLDTLRMCRSNSFYGELSYLGKVLGE